MPSLVLFDSENEQMRSLNLNNRCVTVDEEANHMHVNHA